MAVGEYSVEHFQGLPTLEAARTKFIALDGDELVKTVFRSFFLEHGMESKFGLSMLHRHFDLSPGEMLVDYDGTSVPWPEGSIRGMKRPQPAVWAYSPTGQFRPTEFRYSEEDELVMGESELRFMDSFKDLIHQFSAADLFGLCRYPGDDFSGLCEITQGRANINLKPDDWPKDLIALDTAWFFSAPLWARGCRCTCNTNGENHPHGTHVYTVSG